MRSSVLTLVLAFVACGGSHAKSPGTDMGIDAPRSDAAATSDGDKDALSIAPGFPSTLTFGAASGTVAVTFDETTTGSADAPLGAVALTNGVGTVDESGASASAFLYEQQPFGDLTLYQGFAVSAASWDVFWLYCQGTTLIDVYDEGVDGPRLDSYDATGACSAPGDAVTEDVVLPALSLAAPTPVAGGYTVTGSDITVGNDGAGSVVIGGATLPLTVFDTVDCSTTCGSPGWYELHSLLWDDTHHAAVFVIVYLETESTTSVQLEYARSLPDLGDPTDGGLSLPATWTAMPIRPADGAHPHGMPPRAIP
jgi:hypothetical protein